VETEVVAFMENVNSFHGRAGLRVDNLEPVVSFINETHLITMQIFVIVQKVQR
jgi:hypothetical protein